MMITILSGGTGTPKLIQGIKEIYPQEEISVIVNTVENDYFSGGYISADIDTVMYTFADMIDERYWYGIKGDTFHRGHAHHARGVLGVCQFFLSSNPVAACVVLSADDVLSYRHRVDDDRFSICAASGHCLARVSLGNVQTAVRPVFARPVGITERDVVGDSRERAASERRE